MNKVNCRNPSFYDYTFISDCIFNDIGINDTCIMDYDFKHTTVEPLISFAVGTDMNSVFIVNKNGIDIGIIVSYINKNNIIEGKIFPHKKACKMSAITLMKILTLYNCVYSLFFTPANLDYRVSLLYDHPLLTQASLFVKSILDLQYDMQSNYLVGVCTKDYYDKIINFASYRSEASYFECFI